MVVEALHSTLQELVIDGGCCGFNFLDILFCSPLLEYLTDASAIRNDVIDTQTEFTHAEGFADMVVSTYQQGLLPVFLLVLGCQQDDRQVTEVRILFQRLCQFVSIHLRHHHIRHNEVDVMGVYHIQRFLTIRGGEYVVVLHQQLSHEHQQLYVILYNQQVIGVFVIL